MGGGAAVGSGAVVEHGQFCLEACSFLDAFHQELHDIFDCFLRHSVGLGIVRAACFVEDAVVLAVRLEGLAVELRPPILLDGLGDTKVFEPPLDGLGDGEVGGGGLALHPWVS